MGKYEPLGAFLATQQGDQVAMSFARIEAVLGSNLPPSKRQRAFWSNNPHNNVMTKEWLAAGFESESVDVANEKLVFRRVRTQAGQGNSASGGFADAPQRKIEMSDLEVAGQMPKKTGKDLLAALQANMSGLITPAPGYDPAAPLVEEWPDPYTGDERGR